MTGPLVLIRRVAFLFVFVLVPSALILSSCAGSKKPEAAADQSEKQEMKKEGEAETKAEAEPAPTEPTVSGAAVTTPTPKKITAGVIRDVMQNHIATVSAQNDGAFVVKDMKMDNMEIKLNFVKAHQKVRRFKGKGYYARADFHPVGEEPEKLYDIDFVINDKDGQLMVTDSKIHAHPKKVNGKWTKVERYRLVAKKKPKAPEAAPAAAPASSDSGAR